MIIELVGPSGAGKSTLARRLAAHLDADGPSESDATVPRAFELVARRPLLRRISNEQATNLVEDVRGLPYLVRSWSEHADVLRLCAEMLRKHAPTRFDLAMDARSVMRRIGMYELARQRAGGRVVLLDEGPVLIAYHLFVYSTAEPTSAALARFAETVPLPDRVIYVRSPLPVLAERAGTRPDRRRQVSGLPPERAEAPLRRALEVFDQLVAAPRLSGRTVTVDNDSSDPAQLDRLAAQLATTVRTWTRAPADEDLATMRAAVT